MYMKVCGSILRYNNGTVNICQRHRKLFEGIEMYLEDILMYTKI
jgi:hypothetical protein